MFNFLIWARKHDVMVQFHPADIGPAVVITLADKELNSVEGYILPSEIGLLENELNCLLEELEAKRGPRE